MKKNRMMRLASGLLVAVLLSTCTISGTFAKYVTEGSASDSARVAKFGVTVTGETGTANQAFSQEYATTDGSYAGSVTVSASENVVAPGTSGTMSSFSVEGTPEVAVRITYAPTVELGNNWIDKDDTTKFYCPLKVKVGTTTLCGLDYASADEFEVAIADNIVAAKVDYAPGTDLSSVNDDLQISWEWPFVSDGTYKVNQQTDEKDTFLGDRAAQEVGNAGTIAIDVTCTVTQID